MQAALTASGIVLALITAAAAITTYIFFRRAAHLSRESSRTSSEFERLRRLFENERVDDAEESPGASAEEPSTVPQELIDACTRGECVLFAGPGISASAGLPTRYQLLLQLTERLNIPRESREIAEQLIRSDEYDMATDYLVACTGRDEIIENIRRIQAASFMQSPPIFTSLNRCNFADVITINWDMLLEQAFAARSPVLLHGGPTDDYERALGPSAFTIVKLYGDTGQSNVFRYTTREFASDVSTNEIFHRYIRSLFSENCVLFVGMSKLAIRQFFSAFPTMAVGKYKHYALMRASNQLRANALTWRSAYNLEVLQYPRSKNHSAQQAFIEELADRIVMNRPPGASPFPNLVAEAPLLESLALRNIGPFETMELSIGKGWNVLLGDNGSGKSTVLKAIALALCADDAFAQEAGRRLLRAGQQSGSIDLQIDGVPYRTELSATQDGRVQVKSATLTPVARGAWCVLAFPPLRGVPRRPVTGVTRSRRSRPSIGDVLPLLRGVTDSRIDNLKQWIVNLDVSASEGDQTSKRLLDAFFRILGELMPSSFVGFGHIDRVSWEVFVRTTDAEVPVDQLSQGMMSLLGWVGTTLQRLYEIYPHSSAPERESALVLVDELDAHLHPAWQRVIVPLVKKNFPNLQVIATTHSPLVVNGMDAQEVFVADRPLTGPPVISQAAHGFDGLRADQILTSEAFGLSSTRSVYAEQQGEIFDQLSSKGELTTTEAIDLEKARTYLAGTVFEGSTDALRAAQQEHVRTVLGLQKVVREVIGQRLSSKEVAAKVFDTLAEQAQEPQTSEPAADPAAPQP